MGGTAKHLFKRKKRLLLGKHLQLLSLSLILSAILEKLQKHLFGGLAGLTQGLSVPRNKGSSHPDEGCVCFTMPAHAYCATLEIPCSPLFLISCSGSIASSMHFLNVPVTW